MVKNCPSITVIYDIIKNSPENTPGLFSCFSQVFRDFLTKQFFHKYCAFLATG
jgi:hypothetical protein